MVHLFFLLLSVRYADMLNGLTRSTHVAVAASVHGRKQLCMRSVGRLVENRICTIDHRHTTSKLRHRNWRP